MTRTEQTRRALEARRQAIADRMAEIQADAEHWNRMHPDEEPIVIDMDLGPDIGEALAAIAAERDALVEERGQYREELGLYRQHTGWLTRRLIERELDARQDRRALAAAAPTPEVQDGSE